MKSVTPKHRMTHRSVFLVLLLSATIATAQTQVYKYRDENGNVVFSDRAPNESNAESDAVETVELPALNTAQPPPDMPSSKTKTTSAKSETRYESVITSPPDGTTIPMGPGNFAVTASAKPGLTQGEKLQLKIDGAVYGEPQNGTVWQLQNIYRGEHSLIVERIDRRGKVLHSTTPVTVYVLRPSIR